MDSPTRNLFGLLGLSVILTAYVVCGFVAYILLPFVAEASGPPLAGTLAAAAVAVLLVAAATRAAAAIREQKFASHRLGREVTRRGGSPPTRLLRAAADLGLEGRIDLIESRVPLSFVHGLLEPRVAISRGFLDALDEDELHAVLAHERYHVRNLDPLRAAIGDVLVAAFFLTPSCRVLRDRYTRGRELAADRAARGAYGTRPLCSALLKAVEAPVRREPPAAVSLGGDGLLAERIEQLETGSAPRMRTGIAGLGCSILGTAAFAVLFLAAIAGLGGPGAVTEAVAHELSMSENVLGLACLVPLVFAVALGYGRLARRAREPLPIPPFLPAFRAPGPRPYRR